MVQHNTPFQMPIGLQQLAADSTRGLAESAASRAQTGQGTISDLLNRIKAINAMKVQRESSAGAISNTLAGQANVTPHAAGLTGATVSPRNALNALQAANTFKVNTEGTANLGSVGTFSKPQGAVETLKSASLPGAPSFRGTPTGVASAAAGNPSRTATNRVEHTDFIGRSGENLSFASKRKRVGEVKVKQTGNQTGGIPGIGIPFEPGTSGQAPTPTQKPTAKEAAPTSGVDQLERDGIQSMIDAGFSQEDVQSALDNTPEGSYMAGWQPDSRSVRYLTIPRLGNEGNI